MPMPWRRCTAKVLLKDAGVVSHQWDHKYDAVGRPVAIVAPNGQTVTFSLDASGRMIERTVGTGLVTQYDLHPDGSLKRVAHMAQALSSGTQLGNVQSALLAEHAYTYDIWGNRSTSTDTLSGQTYAKTYGYDALNRIKSVSNGNAAQLETYSFDIFDNLKTKSVGSPVAQSWTYSVDDAHQLKQVQQTVGGTATTALLRYDDNGNLKKLCEGTGLTGTTTDCSGSATTSFTWNGLNELVALAKAGTAVLSEAYAYDDAGRRVRKTSAGVTSHYMLDGPDIVAEWSGSAITGAPTAAYVHGGATDDPVLRLTGASGTPQALSHAFAQDGIGSVTALLSMDAEPANQMRVAGNTLSSSGDFDSTAYPVGKLTDGVTSLQNLEGWVAYVSNGAAVTMNFAAPTSLERIEVYAVSTSDGGFRPSAFVVEVQEGSSGWRQVASGGLSDFVHYEADIIASNDWSAIFRVIKSFPAVSASAVRIRFTATEDTQFGLVWLTEVQAWSTNNSTTQRYDTWGSVAGSASIPMYGFTGREADASGLMYNRARYYSPKYGRFISRDPIGFQGGFNPYAYAANNPVNATDPSGLLPVSPLITSGPSNYYGNGIQVADASPGGGLSQLMATAKDTLMVSDSGKNDKLIDKVQTGLDWLGLMPVLGEPADLANAVIYAARGDNVNAGLSLAATVPFLGMGATGAKIGSKSAIWTSTKSQSVAENAFRHFKDHGADFGAKNAADYVRKAQDFLQNPSAGVLSKTRANGDVVRFDPTTNAFGVMDKTGAPRTFYVPDPAKHGYPTNLDYFNAQ